VQFDSLAAALAMDGHGPYVWAVVFASTLVIVGLLLLPTLSSRRLLREQRSISGSPMREYREQADAPAPTAVVEEVNNAPGA
jgi:heme exporter protein D